MIGTLQKPTLLNQNLYQKKKEQNLWEAMMLQCQLDEFNSLSTISPTLIINVITQHSTLTKLFVNL